MHIVLTLHDVIALSIIGIAMLLFGILELCIFIDKIRNKFKKRKKK